MSQNVPENYYYKAIPRTAWAQLAVKKPWKQCWKYASQLHHQASIHSPNIDLHLLPTPLISGPDLARFKIDTLMVSQRTWYNLEQCNPSYFFVCSNKVNEQKHGALPTHSLSFDEIFTREKLMNQETFWVIVFLRKTDFNDVKSDSHSILGTCFKCNQNISFEA